MNTTRELPIDSIRIDGGTQSRLEINEDYIAELMEIEQLPPPIVFVDGTSNWLADGFHRFFRAKKAGQKAILCSCRGGTKRDAVAFSLSANATHGLKRSTEDKQKSVATALADGEWSKLTDRQIADLCKVSHTFVARQRRGETSSDAAKKTAGKSKKDSAEPITDATAGNVATESVSATGDNKDSGNIQQEQIAEIIETVSGKDDVATAGMSQPAEPSKPWGEFEASIKEEIKILGKVAASLRDLLEYDSDASQLHSKWAHYYSASGTVGLVNGVIRALKDGLPAKESDRDGSHGYISAGRLEVLKKMKVA